MYRPSRLGCSARTEETMRYLGLDVHSKATVFELVDASGAALQTGRVPTTTPDFGALIERLSPVEDLLAGQEVGGMTYFVHDVLTALQVRVLSFNAQQLRMICSSRKKTDRRDAHWIAKALQTGMTPHAVYVPDVPVRRLRSLLSQRDAVACERRRWLLRSRSYLRGAGHQLPRRARTAGRLLELAGSGADGLDEHVSRALEMCAAHELSMLQELKRIDAAIVQATAGVAAIELLKTIPGIGDRVGTAIYAWVGDVRRFPNARALASYVGLVPSVWASAEVTRLGGITKQGSPQLRSLLVQAAQVLLNRCQGEDAVPLQALGRRLQKSGSRHKVAVVATARHLLRVAYYVLRDQTPYDPTRLRTAATPEKNVA
jgi:transposase